MQPVPVDVCTLSTCVEHGGDTRHRSNHDGAKPENSERTQRTCIRNTCASPYLGAWSKSTSLTHRNPIGRTCVHLARSEKERNSLDHVGTETGLSQLGFLLINEGTTGRLVELFGECTTRVLYRAAPEHIRPVTTREMFLHVVHSANLLPSQFEQVLQNGQVSGQTCWTKTGHLLKWWRDKKETSWMRKVLVNKFQENESEPVEDS